MSKNNWIAGDTGTRTNMNQPMWLASGTVTGGNVQLQISSGSIRFPSSSAVVFSGQPQQLTITNPAAGTFYTVFLRSNANASTWIVSGTTTNTIPGAPRWDAEPIGTIFTGASLSTANLKGPWNAGAFDPYEQRGQYVAIGTTCPRLIYDQRSAGTSLLVGGATLGGLDGSVVAVSGLSFLNCNDSQSMGTFLQASVLWIPSGLSSQTISPRLRILNAQNGGIIGSTQDGRRGQDPDAGGLSDAYTRVTTTFTAIAAPGNTTGYQLVWLPQSSFDVVRIVGITFTAQPGFYASNGTEAA